MKRDFFFALVLMLGVTLLGCGDKEKENIIESDVSLVAFYFFEGDSVAEDYSLLELVLKPNYEEQNLVLEYDLTYPNRTENFEFLDIKTEGVVGNEVFVSLFDVLSGIDNLQSVDEKMSNLKVIVDDKKLGVKNYFFAVDAGDEKFSKILNFQNFVNNMFLEDVS